MIPVKLELQGIYSYKEKQVIDFEQLTAAGLFGIFGDVGSGKSSILEAILLALYGSTERLSDKGEKSSMVNLQSEQVLINFEFKAGRNNSRTYLARYSAKRNSKNFDEVRPAEHTFYEKKEGLIEPLSLRGEELVGMKKEHFKQTVIIPQGKFREFIDLTPGPRAEMMKELFGLERFDLSGKTGSLMKSLRENKIRLETQLQALEIYSSEALSQKEIQIKEIAFQTEREEKTCILAEADFQKQEILKIQNQKLTGFLKEWQELQERLPEIEGKKSLWKDFLKAKTHLKPVWNQTLDLQKELEKYKVSVVDCTRFKENYIHEIEKLEAEEQDLKNKANKKSEREAKIRDLKKVLVLQNLKEALKAAELQLEQLIPNVSSGIAEQKEIEEKIRTLEEETEKTVVPDSSQLAELKSAAKDWISLQDQLTKGKSELLLSEQSGKAIQKDITDQLQQLPKEETSFESWIESQKHTLKNLENAKEKLLRKRGLAQHVHLLHDGEPCPLCGALEHPDPLEKESDEQELKQQNLAIEQAKKTLDKIQSIVQKLSEQRIRQENQLSIHQNITSEAAIVQEKLERLVHALENRNILSGEALINYIEQTENEIGRKDKLLHEIKKLRKNLEADKISLEKDQKELQAVEQNILSQNSTIASKREEIQDWNFCRPFFDRDTATIGQNIQNVQKDIEQTADLLNGKQKVLQESRAKQATNLANLKHYTEMVSKTGSRLADLELEFIQLMEIHGFSDRKSVIDLFNHSLDADKVDAEIRQFESRRSIVRSRVEELQNEVGVAEFKLEMFEKLQVELHEKKAALESIKKEFTLLDREIKESRIRLEVKIKLGKEFDILENRESNLKELEKIFKGSGFVKYVSTIYLKELCNTANLRYMKLTKNSLSLEIDENNTFWVVDYLNGGKKRLLKTLSGGQTFQASLCLALALAEKVKSLNQADQSFFFLDEGFGALDRNSLRVVFETLKALRHENRIVGIISHVEELQQEIEVYAKVQLDSEKGSQVGYSF